MPIDYSDFPSPPKAVDYSDFPSTPAPKIDYSDMPLPRPVAPPTISDYIPEPIKRYGQRFGEAAKNVGRTGVAIAGDTLGTFGNMVSSAPGAKQLGQFGNWLVTPKYPEAEKQQIEAAVSGLRPEGTFGSPLVRKGAEFVYEGATAPIGVIPVAGALIGRTALKAVPKIVSKLAPNFLKVAPKVHGPLTMEEAFVQEVKGAQSLRGEQEKLYSKERSRRVREMLKVDALGKGPAGYAAQKAKLGGPLPQVPFASIESKFTPQNITDLYDKIETSKLLSPLDKVSAKSGLEKLMGGVIAGVPEKSEMALLQKLWPDLKTPQLQERWITSLGNVSRTMMAGGDVTSFPLRQGATLVGRPQFWRAIPKGLGSALSEGNYKAAMSDVKKSKFYDLGQDFGGVDITDLNDIQEESFASKWANSLPIIKQSARAYSANANTLRQSLFDELVEKSGKLGRIIDPAHEEFDAKLIGDIGNYVNAATGRGNLGKLEWAARGLNASLFSPRLVSSRLGLARRALIDPFKAPANWVRSAAGMTPYERIDPIVRKEAWRDMFSFMATQAAVLGAAKTAQSLGADVEVGDEPTSTDWGKVKFGKNTRLDFNGGFQPYAVAFAKLAQQAQTSSVSGKRTELEEGYKAETSLDIIQKLVMAKESPLLSFATNFLQGQDLTGQDVNLSREMITKMSPIILQDIVALLKEDPSLLPLIIPANFGAGLQVYGAGEIKRQPKKNPFAVTIPQVRIPKVGM